MEPNLEKHIKIDVEDNYMGRKNDINNNSFDEDNESWGDFEEDVLNDLNDYFGQIGIPNFTYRPYDFYNDNGIDVSKLNRLFLKTDYEPFTNYLIYLAYEYKIILNQKKKKDNTLDIQIQNAKLLQYLRKYFDKKNGLTISYKPRFYAKSYDIDLINLIRNYLENQFSTDNDDEDEDEIEFINITNENLDFLIKRLNRETKKKGPPVRNKNLGEFVELLLYLGSYYSANGKNPHNFKNFNSKNYSIVYEYLYTCKILHDIFSYQGKSIDTLKSTPYDYIRSLINNLRKRKTKKTP